MASVVTQVTDALWPSTLPPRTSVWVILDGSRDDRIYGAVYGTSQEKCCLYAGNLPWQLQMAAPYLVQLERGDKFTNYLIKNGWGKAWGIFLRSEGSLNELRRHLRGFLRVSSQAGKRLVFRYYDPRVLRLYLPTCWPAELETVFGPVSRYVVEGSDPAAYSEFSFDGRKIIDEQLSLESAAARSALPYRRDHREYRSAARDRRSLVIRDVQMDAFRKDRVIRFGNRMVRHIEREYPIQYDTLGEAGTREFVQRATAFGAKHNITSEGAVSVLIELMVEFGEHFERAPDRAKAQKILAHPKLPDYVKVEAIRDVFEARTQGRSLVPFKPASTQPLLSMKQKA